MAALGSLGCSFATMEPPPKDPVQRASSPLKCRKATPIVVDSALAASGLFWVIHANNGLDGDTVDGIHVGPSEADENFYKAERVVGWVQLGVFAASAIYGVVVHTQCPSSGAKPKDSEAFGGSGASILGSSSPSKQSQAARPAFPSSVYAYHFNMSLSDAGMACTGAGQPWKVDGAVGTCSGRSQPPTSPDVRLTYSLGAVHAITVIYSLPNGQLAAHYDRLHASLVERYGKPQVERAPPSEACAASLEACLEQGERPRGTTWHWPAGSVELVPIFDAGRAVIELRHTREES